MINEDLIDLRRIYSYNVYYELFYKRGDFIRKISVVIPCYNEEKSVEEMYTRLMNVFSNIPNYDYEIIYVDDCSPDNTWNEIVNLANKNERVKGIHNVTNFGPARNIFHSVSYGTGDAVFLLMGDIQQPPEMLLEFVKQWELGHKVVIGVHPNTESKGIMALMRKGYYKFMDYFSNNKMIPNFNCFGLYDKVFVDVLNSIENTEPYFTGVVAEYGGNIKSIEVPQEESKRGESNQNFFKKYDYGMIGLTSYTKILMRLATFVGFSIGVLSAVFALIVFVLKLLNWNSYPMGIPSILIGVFFLGAIQIFFLGILGEYVLSINERSMKRPLTAIDDSINMNF